MARASGDQAWVFVSHASADLAKVRQVRNFMEEKGAGPILFHLKSLATPERFWPLIKAEIEARNFFLLCDSEAARASEWVQRERQAVEQVAQRRAIRVGRLSLDGGQIDFSGLERFLLNLQVYVVHPSGWDPSAAFETLERYGYGSLGAVGLSEQGLSHLGERSQMRDDLVDMMYHGAARGWLLVVLNKRMAESAHFWNALPASLPGARVMFVLLEKASLAANPPVDVIDATLPIVKALDLAAQRMLTGGKD